MDPLNHLIGVTVYKPKESFLNVVSRSEGLEGKWWRGIIFSASVKRLALGDSLLQSDWKILKVTFSVNKRQVTCPTKPNETS